MNVHEKSGLLRLNFSSFRTASSAGELLAHVQLSLHRMVIATLVITDLQLLLIHRNCYGDYKELYIHV